MRPPREKIAEIEKVINSLDSTRQEDVLEGLKRGVSILLLQMKADLIAADEHFNPTNHLKHAK